MEEKEKVPTTPEPNPNGEDEVKATDVLDGEPKAADPAEEGQKDAAEENPDKSAEDGKPNPKAQDRETDAKNAERRRRAKEREAQRQKEREDEIRRQAVFDVKSGQVTADELRDLSLDKVENEDQLFLVEQYRKAKADGNENPQADAYKALFKKQNEEKAAAQAKAEADRKAEQAKLEVVRKDQIEFKAKFGKTTAEVMQNEEEFMSLFGDAIDQEKGNFTKLYAAYTAMKQGRAAASKKDGSFPTNSKGKTTDSGEESDEEFMKRYQATYGHW